MRPLAQLRSLRRRLKRLFKRKHSQKRRYLQTVFTRDWGYRFEGLFEAGIEFSGRSILDAGCNVGIILYEIAKQRPSSIHGIDYYPPFIETSRQIFRGYRNIPHRFDVADLTKPARVADDLDDSYDVVLFMAVFQHLRAAHGDAIATDAARLLARRCREFLIVRNSGVEVIKLFDRIAAEEDFKPIYRFGEARQLVVFKRETTTARP